MTNYRRKANIQAWKNHVDAPVPRWVLRDARIETDNDGNLVFLVRDGDLASRSFIPYDSWLVMEGRDLKIYSAHEFAAQFEPAP